MPFTQLSPLIYRPYGGNLYTHQSLRYPYTNQAFQKNGLKIPKALFYQILASTNR